MPSNDDAPTFALLSEVDSNAWSGTVMDIIAGAGGEVNIPTSQEYWEDGISFLNGRGSDVNWDMDGDLQVQVTAAGGAAMNVFIDTDDLVTITCTSAFTLAAGFGEEAFGFPSAPYNSTNILGVHTLKAPDDWVRGTTTFSHLNITEGINVYNVPSIGYKSQDIVTLFRASTLTDADAGDALNNMQDQINDVGDNLTRRFRLGINDNGKVFIAWPSGTGIASFDADAFANDDFQRWMGYDGTEVATFYAGFGYGIWLLEANNYCAGAMIPSRPIQKSILRFTEETNTIALTSGDIASNKVSDWASIEINWRLDGPADCIDLSSHFVNEFVPRNQKGKKLNYYPVWGDPRRARNSADVRTFNAVSTPEYDLLGTSELDGYRGRFRGRRDIGDPSKKNLKWPGALRRRLPMSTFIRAVED